MENYTFSGGKRVVREVGGKWRDMLKTWAASPTSASGYQSSVPSVIFFPSMKFWTQSAWTQLKTSVETLPNTQEKLRSRVLSRSRVCRARPSRGPWERNRLLDTPRHPWGLECDAGRKLGPIQGHCNISMQNYWVVVSLSERCSENTKGS